MAEMTSGIVRSNARRGYCVKICETTSYGDNDNVGLTNENDARGIVRNFCLFCTEPLTRARTTREHVIPQWLLRELRISDQMVSPAGWQRGKAATRRRHPWSRLVISDVCGNCNSGWLSRLEDEVKPLVTAFAHGDGGMRALAERESLTLARWATKTAFLIQRTAGISVVIPPESFEDLRNAPARIAAETFVFAYQDDGRILT